MRVRFPPSPPTRPSSNGSRSRALNPEMRVRIPPTSPDSAAEGRDGDLGGLISLTMRVRFPPPRPTAGSFKGRTAVLQTAHGGSIPSPATTQPEVTLQPTRPATSTRVGTENGGQTRGITFACGRGVTAAREVVALSVPVRIRAVTPSGPLGKRWPTSFGRTSVEVESSAPPSTPGFVQLAGPRAGQVARSRFKSSSLAQLKNITSPA